MLKIFFEGAVSVFCMLFLVLLLFLFGVSFSVLRCASMLVSVTFNVAKRDD